MNLYMDDDSAKTSLTKMLRSAGYQVVVPADVGLTGASDPRHLLQAIQSQLAVLTRNHGDFQVLHLLIQAAGGNHCGILVVRHDNDPTRDMKDREIRRAIANLEAAGVPIANEFHVLNQWR